MVRPMGAWCALFAIMVALAACGTSERQGEIPYKLETTSSEDVSPRDLFERARALRNPEEKLALYRQIVSDHGDSELADASQFMIGFVYAEELGDTAAAVKELRMVREQWPESDWCDDAEALIHDLEG